MSTLTRVASSPGTASLPIRSRHVPQLVAVAAGLIGGVLVALVLAIGVFPGATESVETASLLLGAAAGSGLLWLITARLTTRPQTWAGVPAVSMAASGLALLIFRPADGVLTVFNWIWPPLLVVLIIWTGVRARSALTGPSRWVMGAVLVLATAASAGAVSADVAELRTAQSYPAPGRIISVGDHRLHLDCRGSGSPTVVLFSGLGEVSASWAHITDRLAPTTRTCAYDRAGQAWSDDVASPQDGIAATTDLHRLLAAAGETGPFVLAGHSIGGPFALIYSARYPGQVAGMALLDSSSPYQMTRVLSYPGQYAVMLRGLALMPTADRLGLGPLSASGQDLPGEEAAQVQAVTSTVRLARNGRDELTMLPTVFKQSQALTTLGHRPLVVLTTTESLRGAGWAATQNQLASLSSNRLHRTIDSTHAGLVDERHGASESATAIEQVVAAVRAGAPLESR
jgi:pimeloyl-ACP methyl ester carboxylesterase